MEAIKRLPLEEAARIGRECLTEMLEKGADVEDEDVRTVATLCHHAETIDDKSLAGGALIIGGVLCAAVAFVIGLCGAYYARSSSGNVPADLGLYALGYGLFAVLQFCVVRLTKRRFAR